jgi:hypothetical protein
VNVVLEGLPKVRKSVVRSIVIASALAFSVGMAAASTVSLKFDGGTANGVVTITNVPEDVKNPGRVGAYGFNMVDVTAGGSVLGKFVAWCLDLDHYLAPAGKATPYTVTKTPFSNSYGLDADDMKRVQSVFNANFANVVQKNDIQAAAFQVALWDALYDDDFRASDGDFKINRSDIRTQADVYLAAAKAYTGKKVWNLTFLESKDKPTRQNLVTVTPVPVPAAAGLMLLALGGLAAVGRRRRAA